MSNDPNVFLKTLRGLEFEEKTPPIKIYLKTKWAPTFNCLKLPVLRSHRSSSMAIAVPWGPSMAINGPSMGIDEVFLTLIPSMGHRWTIDDPSMEIEIFDHKNSFDLAVFKISTKLVIQKRILRANFLHISDLFSSYKQMVFSAIEARFRRIFMRTIAILPGFSTFSNNSRTRLRYK